MKYLLALLVVLSGVIALRVLRGHEGSAQMNPEPMVATSKGEGVPVVVELFTSEGCSSCPPADELLAKLDKMPGIEGVQVIALGEHVDYWNNLGWVDRFSSEKFSQRQNEYSEALKSRGLYTPQMIVDGRVEFVGGNVSRAREAIAKAAQSPKGKIQLQLSQDNSDTPGLSVRVESLPKITTGDTAEVVLAVTEDNLRTEVSQGENSGRYLNHSAVVRELSVLGAITGSQTTFAAEPKLKLEPTWQRENLRAVALVQERGSRRVIGAAMLSLARDH